MILCRSVNFCCCLNNLFTLFLGLFLLLLNLFLLSWAEIWIRRIKFCKFLNKLFSQIFHKLEVSAWFLEFLIEFILPTVCCWLILTKFYPFIDIFQNDILLEVEVASNDIFEPEAWIPQLVKNAVLEVRIPHQVLVPVVHLFTALCPHGGSPTWLIEVDFVRHDDCLDRKQDLVHRGDLPIPVIRAPCAKQRQTDVSTVVEVRVEPDRAASCSH